MNIKRLVSFKDMVVYGTKTIQIRMEKERLEKAIRNKYGLLSNDPGRALALEEVRRQDILLGCYKSSTEKAWKSFID